LIPLKTVSMNMHTVYKFGQALREAAQMGDLNRRRGRPLATESRLRKMGEALSEAN
jgi:hypothetical protein